MAHFNYTPNSKTPKGSAPRAIRMITKDHDAYKIYLLAQKLQAEETGSLKNNVYHKFVEMAIEQFNNKTMELK